MSSRTSRGAQIGCVVAGIITWVVGVTFSFSSGAARALYGPSSPYAEYVADSCSKEITIIGCFGGGETGYFDSSSMLPVPPGDPAIPAWRGPGCGATVLNGVPTYDEIDARTDETAREPAAALHASAQNGASTLLRTGVASGSRIPSRRCASSRASRRSVTTYVPARVPDCASECLGVPRSASDGVSHQVSECL